MKKLLLLYLVTTLSFFAQAQYCGNSGISICTPSGNFTAPGLYPSGEDVPPIVNGVTQSLVFQFENYNVLFFNLMPITINSFKIDSIKNLPSGFCWNTNKPNDTWINSEKGCLVLNGPGYALPGVYKLQVFITVNTSIGTFGPVLSDTDPVNLKFFLRVVNPGQIAPPLDTTQVIPFIAYGNPIEYSFLPNVSGTVYKDDDSDCVKNTLELTSDNLKINYYENGILTKVAYTSGGGNYVLRNEFTTAEISLDTLNLPFEVTCPSNGSHTVTITPQDSIQTGIDFSLKCKPGYDLTAHSMVVSTNFRPANFTNLYISAGLAASFFNLNCAGSVSGSVQLIYDGPISYVSPIPNSLTPVVTGDTLTWTIADFSTVNFFTDFGVIFQTDTFAQIGQNACFTLSVSPTANDINPLNNILDQCFSIVNSYDPNDKTAHPAGNIDTAQKELRYTIRFQNTGNAEAQHIFITDTLDTNIDETSFQLLAYSHKPNIDLRGKAIRFNFPFINLPDSFSNEPESHGYIQYKVKLKNNLPIGTKIDNTAFIYFDFNPPVVTNTTVNTIALPTSIREQNAESLSIALYPNPATNVVFIETNASLIGANVSVMDVTGRYLNQFTINAVTQEFSTQKLSNGLYFVTVHSNDGKRVTKRLLISK